MGSGRIAIAVEITIGVRMPNTLILVFLNRLSFHPKRTIRQSVVVVVVVVVVIIILQTE